jgi:hypothetical protein
MTGLSRRDADGGVHLRSLDGQGGISTATGTVTVEGTNRRRTEDGGAVTGQLDATDIDGDDLTFSAG